jgi:hypothetical protein
MPTPTGTISFSNIESEFGRNGSKSLGAYRVSQSAGLYSNLPLDTGVPQSGSISFSQLRGKRLNIVVDISGAREDRVNIRSKYNVNAGVTVIGGFTSKPADPSQKRILVSVNKTIGSSSASRNHVALRTGTWGTSATLQVLLGPSARIIGSGGKGGDFTATTTTQSGTAVYAERCLHFRDYKGNVYLSQCKGYDPNPPAGDWTSGWYPGNYVFIPSGKSGFYGYEARRNWSATSASFTANAGSPGSSAIGIDYQTTLTNNGYIQNGFGGGGAGGYRSR